jgi:hypothetical protein
MIIKPCIYFNNSKFINYFLLSLLDEKFRNEKRLFSALVNLVCNDQLEELKIIVYFIIVSLKVEKLIINNVS